MGVWGDRRGVSEVVGAILIFGLLITALGMYQAFVVPNQTASVEIEHNDRVADDMQELRNVMLKAAGDGEPRSASVELGPRYPTRMVSLNPGPASGSLETVAKGDISIENAEFTSNEVCDRGPNPDKPSTASIRYVPRYNAHENGQPVVIDSSMVYRDTGGNALVDTPQLLVQGSRIQFLPVEGNLSTTGDRATSVTVIPSNNGGMVVSEDAEENFNISIPTQLSADEWEAELQEASTYVVAVHDVPGEARVKVELEGTANGGPSSYTFRCTAIGINQQPSLSPPELPFTDAVGDTQDGLNPYGAFVLEDSWIDDDDNAELQFRNRGEDAGIGDTTLQITEMRFVYYGPVGQGQGGGGGQPFIPPDTATYADVSFELGGSALEVDGDEWAPGAPGTITISFERDGSSYDVKDGDFFVVRIRLEGDGIDPIIGEYFVGPRD